MIQVEPESDLTIFQRGKRLLAHADLLENETESLTVGIGEFHFREERRYLRHGNAIPCLLEGRDDLADSAGILRPNDYVDQGTF